MIKDSLGDRMKNYEAVTKTTLVSRMPVIIRLDGCHFHTFTRGMQKPFDPVLNASMQATMKYLCENIQGCVLGYTQSDEITLVLVDYERLNSSAWYDNEVQKMVSVSAALATFAFNRAFKNEYEAFKIASCEHLGITQAEKSKLLTIYYDALAKGAYFDSRVFNVPKEDVTNCVYWRQKDAERNSINSLAQSLFSHKSLQGLSLKDTLTKIEQEKGIIWGNLPTEQKRGTCCIKADFYGDKQLFFVGADESGWYYRDAEGNKYPEWEIIFTTKWVIDKDIPMFKDEGRAYIEELINVGE